MSSQIGFPSVIQVRCSMSVWPMLGWRQGDPCETSPEPDPLHLTSLVQTPWHYEQRPIKFQLWCGPSPQ
jgi:hypothetical protein